MPIYEYQCDACHHKFERLQKFSDDLLTVCPECKEEKLRKLVSAAAFHLKGTGWYETDFKDKKPKEKTDKTEDKSSSDNKSTGDTSKTSGTKETSSTSKDSGSTSTKKPEKTKSSD